MGATNKSTSGLGVVLIMALLFLSGCVHSDTAVLTESDQVKVPDLSGTYLATGMFERTVVIARKQNNVFSVKQDDDPEEEAILVPLDVPDAYLFQLQVTGGEGDGFLLAAILVKDGDINVSMLAPVMQEAMSDAFEEEDNFRKAVGEAIQKRFEAVQKKHGVKIRDSSLVNNPSQETVVAFFNACFLEANFLTTSEVLEKQE